MALRHRSICVNIVYDDVEVNPEEMSLADIAEESINGAMSMDSACLEDVELTPSEAYDFLQSQGSDPEFFGIFKCPECEEVFQSYDNECPYCTK